MTPVPYNGQTIEDDAFKVLITGFGVSKQDGLSVGTAR